MEDEVCLSWPSHGKVLSDSLWKFFKDSYRTDLDISLNGHILNVHHLILSIFCPLIKETESDKFIKSENLSIDKDDLKHLVEFVYRGKVNVLQNRLPYLLKGAESLGFQSLANVIKKYLVVHNKKEILLKDVKEGKLTTKKAYEKLKQLKSSTNDDKDSGESSNLDILDSVDKEDSFYKEKPSYRRTLDYDSFDPTSLQHICKHCKQGFEVFDDYVNHVRQHENPELTHNCPHCSYKARLKCVLVQHVIAKHEVDLEGNKLERNVKCPKCSYTCFAKFQLKNHTYTSHVNKPFKCSKCPYASMSKANLGKHERIVHQNERPFMCETCGSRFKTFQTFRNHLTIHLGKKRVCEVCGAHLTVNSFLSHMKTHSEERPFACHLCSFAARKRYNLKKHLQNVHKLPFGELEERRNSTTNVEEDQKIDDDNTRFVEINPEYEYEIIASSSILPNC